MLTNIFVSIFISITHKKTCRNKFLPLFGFEKKIINLKNILILFFLIKKIKTKYASCETNLENSISTNDDAIVIPKRLKKDNLVVNLKDRIEDLLSQSMSWYNMMKSVMKMDMKRKSISLNEKTKNFRSGISGVW